MTPQEWMKAKTWELARILKTNAPVRDPFYLHKNGKYYKTWSKYGPPGNLKNNGINPNIGKFRASVKVGGPRAPYAKFTETTSRKKGWMQKSKIEFINRLVIAGAKRT